MPSPFLQRSGSSAMRDELQQMIAEKMQRDAVDRQVQQQQFQQQIQSRQMGVQEQNANSMELDRTAQAQRDIAAAQQPQPDKFGDWQKQYDYELAHPKQSATPASEPLVEVDEGGQPVLKPRSQAAGLRAYHAPVQAVDKPDKFGDWQKQYDYELAHPKQTPGGGTVGGTIGLQRARADSASMMIGDLEKVHGKLQVGNGPGQLGKGALNYVQGKFNMNNAATEYRKKRLATAVALAVAIQGSRPSDKDAEAMADLLPDFDTPKDVAKNLFQSTRDQLGNVSNNMGGAGQPKLPPPQPGGVYDWVDGKLVPSGGAR